MPVHVLWAGQCLCPWDRYSCFHPHGAETEPPKEGTEVKLRLFVYSTFASRLYKYQGNRPNWTQFRAMAGWFHGYFQPNAQPRQFQKGHSTHTQGMLGERPSSAREDTAVARPPLSPHLLWHHSFLQHNLVVAVISCSCQLGPWLRPKFPSAMWISRAENSSEVLVACPHASKTFVRLGASPLSYQDVCSSCVKWGCFVARRIVKRNNFFSKSCYIHMYTGAQHTYVCGANVFWPSPVPSPRLSPSVSLLSGNFHKHVYCVCVCTVCIHTYSHVCTQAVFFFPRISTFQSQKLSFSGGMWVVRGHPFRPDVGFEPSQSDSETCALCATLKGYFFTTDFPSWEKQNPFLIKEKLLQNNMPLNFYFYWLTDRFLFQGPFCVFCLWLHNPLLSLVCPLQADAEELAKCVRTPMWTSSE